MSEQEQLKSLMKPLLVFANSGGEESITPTGKDPPNSSIPRKRKEAISKPTPTAKPKKPKPKQQKEITIDNFV